MSTPVLLLFFCQALGASIGAFSAVWSEIAYLRAARHGGVDAAERAHLRVIARGLRFGMFIFLLASLGLVVVAYRLQAAPQPALSAGYWTSITLALIVIGASWALSRRRIAFALGSAIVFTAWWFLAYFVLGWLPSFSFGAIAAFFVITTAIFYTLLQYGHFLATRTRP